MNFRADISGITNHFIELTLDTPVVQTAGELLVCLPGDSSITVEGAAGAQDVVISVSALFVVTAEAPTVATVGASDGNLELNGSAVDAYFHIPLSPPEGPQLDSNLLLETPADVELLVPVPGSGGWGLGFLPL